MRFRELTRFCEFRVCSRRWRKKDSIGVANFLDETKPAGKPDLSVVGVPGFSGLVPGPSASAGFHDTRSVIMDGGSVNRGIVPAEAQHPISTSVTTGSTSSGASYFAVEALIFALHMESPEGAPLSVKVGCSQIQHRLRADGSQRIPVRSKRSLTRCRHAPSTTPLPIG